LLTSARSMSAKRLSPASSIHPTAELESCTLGRYTEVGARSRLLEVVLSDYSYIMNDSEVAYATFGKFCSVAAMTRINPGNHPMSRASQSHFTYRASAYFPDEADEESFFDWRRSHHVHVGHDVWIGHGAIILPGRTVGDGAVIGAGAVVTKDVPPFAVAAGNPARVIRQRFPEEIGVRLQRLAWWHWSHEQLRQALPNFRRLTIDQFLDHYEEQHSPPSPDRSTDC